MASQPASTGPVPASASTPSPQLQAAFDNSIWYILSLWPALHVAVQNNWGGSDSKDKQDWFAGAVSDLFAQKPDVDFDDVVIFLLQVMQDEFDCNVEDDSEEDIARALLQLRKRILSEGDIAAAREVEQRWKNRGQMKVDVKVVDGEIDGDEDELEGWEDDDGDVEMGDSTPDLIPAVASKKEKPIPEVDEEGFTKVVGKKQR